MKPTHTRHEAAQSLWLDDVTRRLLDLGTLQTYIEQYSPTGLTSNPIFFGQGHRGRLRLVVALVFGKGRHLEWLGIEELGISPSDPSRHLGQADAMQVNPQRGEEGRHLFGRMQIDLRRLDLQRLTRCHHFRLSMTVEG
jgi:hypothetical protein